MKRKIIFYGLLPTLVGAGLVGATVVSAHGYFGFGMSETPDQIVSRQQTMFQQEADLLGISVDAVKAGWAKGETLQQIAADNGITADAFQEKLKNERSQQMKNRLQTLVDKGVITQVQADSRLQFLQSKMQNAPLHGHSRFRSGFMF